MHIVIATFSKQEVNQRYNYVTPISVCICLRLEYYSQEITEILPEITYAPTPSINPTTPTREVNPIGETFTTAPAIEIGVMTENHESRLVTLKTDRCEYTEFGCCPDGKTAARTAEYTDCPGELLLLLLLLLFCLFVWFFVLFSLFLFLNSTH